VIKPNHKKEKRMSETTYRYLFDEYIKERLREGGEPDYMVSLVRIYSKEDDDSSLCDYAFQEWLREGDFTCGKSGTRFQKPEENTDRYTKVLCPRCRKACKDG